MKKFLLLLFVLSCSLLSFAENKDDFSTITTDKDNPASSYLSRTSTAGWSGTYCALVNVGDYTSLTMNGRKESGNEQIGTITSPKLSNGISKLTFHYANTYSESKGVKVQVDIIQNDKVVITNTLEKENSAVTKGTDYSITYDNLNISGDFTIKFTNLCPSNSTAKSNKDRVSIYGISWDNYEGAVNPDAVSKPTIYVTNGYKVRIICDEGDEIHYTLDGTDPTYTSTLYKGEFELEGPCTIKARAFKGVNKSEVESYTVYDTDYPRTSLAGINNLITGTDVKVKADMTVFCVYDSYILITDGTTNTLAYKYVSGLATGDNISFFSGKTEDYKAKNSTATTGLFEIKDLTWESGTKTVEYPVHPCTNISELYHADNYFDVVEIKGATIEYVSSKKYTIALNGNERMLYNQLGLENIPLTETTETYTVKAVVGSNPEDGTLQLWPMEITKEEVIDNRKPSGFSFANPTESAYVDEDYTFQTLNNPENIDVVWTSSNEDVLFIDEDGEYVILSPGTTTITAEPADAETYYGKASYKLTVTKRPVSITFSTTSVTVMEGEEVEAPTFTVDPAGVELAFTSSNDQVADATDTEIEAYAPGEAIITARPADTDKYEGSATYTITVTAKPKAPVVTVTIGDKTYTDEEGIDTEVVEGTALNISAPTAQTITIDIEDGEKIVSQGATTTWTPAVGDYTATISATNAVGTSEDFLVFLTVTEKPAIYTDVLDLDKFTKVKAVSGTSYTDDTYESPNGITYTAKIAKNASGEMQFNGASGNGVIVTGNTNGYVFNKITIEYGTNTTTRTFNIYGKADVYTDGLTTLKTNTTLIGGIATNAENLTLTPKEGENYKGIGMIVATSNAVLIKKITIEWKEAASDGKSETKLSFDEASYTCDINDEFTAPKLNNPYDVDVTWTSSNKNVAEIDATTGVITVKSTGTTTIAAAFAGNDKYSAATVSYTLNVTDRNVSNYTFDFLTNDYGMTRQTGDDFNPETYVFSDKWIGVKLMGKQRLWSTKGLRMYKGASMTIHMPENCEIVAVSALNAEGSIDNARTKEFTISENSPVIYYNYSGSSNVDLAKISISYKPVSEEEIAEAFKASTLFNITVNGDTHDGGVITKTADADAKIELAHHYPHAKVYTKWVAAPRSQSKGVVTLALDGYEEHTSAMNVSTAGTLSYYAELNGVTTPVYNLTVEGDNTTGISEINADNVDAEWYDLAGRRVMNPANGIFIRKVGNSVSKHAL